MARICIDNGHGLKTAGKRTPPFPNTGQVIHEWQFNHATANILKDILEEQGHQVLMVSDTPNDTPLMTRTDKANQWGADIFISIHYNAYQSTWGTHGGIETLYHPKSVDGKRLAQLVQKELIGSTKLRDRGIKARTNLAVLNYTKMVSILPELGFMDNLEEAKLMLDVGYQTKCAVAIAKGVNRYLGYSPAIKGGNIMANKPIVPPQMPIQNNNPSTWAIEAWNWGKQQGLLDGTRPKDPVTREELAIILKRLYDRKLI